MIAGAIEQVPSGMLVSPGPAVLQGKVDHRSQQYRRGEGVLAGEQLRRRGSKSRSDRRRRTRVRAPGLRLGREPIE